MKKYDLDILFNDKDLLEELIYEDESEEEVIEDDTVEEVDDDINENEEILSTLNKLTHITNESGQKVGSYCFVEEIMNIYGLSQEEVIDIAKHNGYKIMKVFPNEQVDGGFIIADKECSGSHIKDDYLKFYGVEAEVKELKESLTESSDTLDIMIKDKKTGEETLLKNRTFNQLELLNKNKDILIVYTTPHEDVDESIKEDDEISQSFKIPSKNLEIVTSPIEYKDSDWSYEQFDGFYHFKEEDFETELEALDYFIWDNEVLYNSSEQYKNKLIVKTFYKGEFKSEYTFEQAKKIVNDNKGE